MVRLKLGEFRSSIEKKSIETLFEAIESLQPLSSNLLIVTDEKVAPLLTKSGRELFILPSGESEKNFTSLKKIIKRATEKGLGRDSLFVGIGGGVICDLTAFAASIFMRGVRLVLVPTTLLSMVDAAIGGKTGIDYDRLKNQVGSFYPASTIYIVPEFLRTLPEVEWRSGLGEVFKSALLRDPKLLSLLENQSEEIKRRDPKWLDFLIFRSIGVKSYFIQKDFKEQHIRAHLNLGHTFAHALESFYACRGATGGVSHGEAVVWGIFQAACLASFLFPLSARAKQIDLIKKIASLYNFKLDYEIPFDQFLQAISHDKKNIGQQFRFVLQKAPFKTLVLSVSEEQLKRSSALADLG